MSRTTALIITLLAVFLLTLSILLIVQYGIPALNGVTAVSTVNPVVAQAATRSIVLPMPTQTVPTAMIPTVTSVTLLATPVFPDATSATVFDDSDAEILRLLNAARMEQGFTPLMVNALLVRAATDHSADQARRDVMSHDGSDGSTLGDRVNRVSYRWGGVAENVLMRWDTLASEAFDQWWNSPGHYQNMMNPDYTEIGIAHERSASGSYYYTMVLGTPS